MTQDHRFEVCTLAAVIGLLGLFVSYVLAVLR